MLLNGWTCAGHVSQVAAAGDWITLEIGAESAIVVRGAAGALHALANVCRHRGSRLCAGPAGSAKTLVCPYHAWSYNLDGSLRAARQMPEDIVAADHGLRRLALREIGGLIFVSFADAPPEIDGAAAALGQLTTRYGWDTAQIAHRETYVVNANWKLALENYHECYHCMPAHPEFSVAHVLARPGARTVDTAPDITGYRDVEHWPHALDGAEVVRVMRSALAENCLTGSADGKLLAPLMGPADGQCVFAELGFLSAFLAYADHGVMYRFVPRGVCQTEMEVVWLVRGDAVEARDYDRATLTWLWHVTSLADKKIIDANQKGVASRFYVPGPFSLMEPATRAYVERYVSAFAALP